LNKSHEAAGEFHKFVDHPSLVANNPLTKRGLSMRLSFRSGGAPTLIPLLMEAKIEYARLP
jgi:hypothetical protein